MLYARDYEEMNTAQRAVAKLKSWRFAARREGSRVILELSTRELNPEFRTRLGILGFSRLK